MRSINQTGVALSATIRALSPLLGRHRAVTRVATAALALTLIFVSSIQQPSQAGPVARAPRPASILPENIGVGVRATDPVSLRFASAMDRASVEANLTLQPDAGWHAVWKAGNRTLQLIPARRWQTDARYVVTVGSGARTADGSEVGAAQWLSFTTQTGPAVTAFRLRFPTDIDAQRMRVVADAAGAAEDALTLASTPDTLSEVSTQTRIVIGFSTAMNRRDVERRFVISPEVEGTLDWDGNSLVFIPVAPLSPEARYAVTVAGARDRHGNRLGGDVSFSFTTRVGAQLVTTSPKPGAIDVTDGRIRLMFSQPMSKGATTTALEVVDLTTGAAISGRPSWSADRTRLTFEPAAALAKGHKFEVRIGEGAQDADHNALTAAFTFTTKAAPAPPAPAPRTVSRPAATGPPPPADLAEFALWQVNQARATYGFAPLVLDGAISGVASAHAADMIQYGYFSHTGRDGSRVADRLRRAGISFSSSGENLCYYNGITARAMLQWCHSVFMSEPYPGHFNHIANILSPRFSRMGVGIAQSGGRMIIVWNFAG